MISRSLGVAAGAAIGIPLFFAQALSITFYVVGFTEALSPLMPGIDGRILGTATCVGLTLLTLKGAEVAIRVQYFVMAAIVLSLVSFLSGGLSDAPAEIAWWNPEGAPFGVVFAVFFPAVTGIMAGVSMSGDLRNPRRDLPLGTLTALLVGFLVYLVFPVWLALNVGSDRLLGELDIVWKMSRWPQLIYLGVWGATLSSAVGSVLAAPRTLQAVAADGAMPRLFARGSGPANEPRLGLLFTFLLAEIGILVGSLDLIAPVLTMFFLATYGMTNLACGLEKWAASPSFRPTFSVPWWLSVLGALACVYVMTFINVLATVVAVVVCGIIFLVAERRALNTAFGDARHGILAALVGSALHRLRRTEFHPINWRPNLVIFGGQLAKRDYLVDLGSAMVQDRGIVSFFHLLEGEVAGLAEDRQRVFEKLDSELAARHPNVFTRVEVVEDLFRGMVTSAQSYGIGTFEANTVMFGLTREREREAPFLDTLRSLQTLDRSLLVVHFDPERGFGSGRRIDIWWGGLNRNGLLMLLLAFLLSSHDLWKAAEVRVLTVVSTSFSRSETEKRLGAILDQTRLKATVRVIPRHERSVREIMERESAGTDLSLVGLRPPTSRDRATEYFAVYRKLLEVLPTTILVSGAPRFEGTPVLFDAPEEPPATKERETKNAEEVGEEGEREPAPGGV